MWFAHDMFHLLVFNDPKSILEHKLELYSSRIEKLVKKIDKLQALRFDLQVQKIKTRAELNALLEPKPRSRKKRVTKNAK